MRRRVARREAKLVGAVGLHVRHSKQELQAVERALLRRHDRGRRPVELCAQVVDVGSLGKQRCGGLRVAVSDGFHEGIVQLSNALRQGALQAAVGAPDLGRRRRGSSFVVVLDEAPMVTRVGSACGRVIWKLRGGLRGFPSVCLCDPAQTVLSFWARRW